LAQGVAASLRMDLNPNALGGSSGYFLAFLGVGGVASIILLHRLKGAQGIAARLLRTLLVLGGVLLGAGLLWLPFFWGFEPQQNKIMWVKPDVRTSIWNYFNVYGFFLVVLLMSPWTAYLKPVLDGLDRKEKKAGRFDWAGLPERLGEWFAAFLRPGGAVKGMLGLGVLTLLLFFGASWVHWVESPTGKLLSQAIATVAAGFLGAALWTRDRWGLWMGFAACILLWATLLAAHILPLSYSAPLTLGLGFFSVLWLLAFLHLGLAVKTFTDRGLSFGYFLVSFFFFVTATLEILVMSEYFGFGDGMRNNSMFKYGIVAWTLASVATGIFLPRVLVFLGTLLASPKKEGARSRGRFFLIAGGFLWALFRILMDPFLAALDKPAVFVVLAFLVAVLAGLTFILEWPSKRWFLGGAVAVVPVLLFSSLNFGYGSGLGVLQRAAATWSSKFLLPLILAVVVVCSVGFVWEKRKDLGRRAVAGAWGACALLLLGMISLYPWAATLRKGHGIFDASRKAWLGWSEPRTLNGLAFIRKENPGDAAAIKFLQERVPGQPCLVEFVGEGYNSWASRFSIFTGIPALMGWDGHVGEWVGAKRGDDIRARFNATERIFRTTDPSEAKKYLDAYGVRLVMVGTVERNGVPGRKGGYPSEGLAKFSGMLPLIYRNPQVEIYFNPPSE
jgi:hypothetical protein